ncbi:MAG TPA: FGGY-family carbohydrate kinase [Acidimicrobiales bacterium]|jgi:xylulokinase
METTVGLDIGTTSVKAVAADGDGRVVARTQVRHAVKVPTAGRFEHDPGEVWRDNVWVALRRLGDPTDLGVRGVNVSAMVPSLAAFGSGGSSEPLSRGLLYGDERGSRYKTPDNDEGEYQAFLETLAGDHPSSAHFWPAQACANHALGGVGAIDTTTCATTTPVWFGTSWNSRVLDEIGVRAATMPQVAELGAQIGALGDHPDVALAAGSIDAMGEQIVAGADELGDVLVILGTTLITWAAIDDWRTIDGLWTIPSMTAPNMLVGGPSNAGGLFVGWVRDLVGDGPGDEHHGLDPAAIPLWLPYVRGERVPLHDTGRRAELHGGDLSHGAAAVRRAAFEASGFTVRRVLDQAVAGGAFGDGPSPRRIVATGGGVRVPAWTQSLADATGLPVDVVEVPEGGALGSAWFARMAAGLEPDGMAGAPRWARLGGRVEPDPVWAAQTADRYTRWSALVDRSVS